MFFLCFQIHETQPFTMDVGGEHHEVSYIPGESNTYVFGGNSNWRGPIWLCGELSILRDQLSFLYPPPLSHAVNFLIIETLERYYYFYGDDMKVECPTGSGVQMNLLQVSHELCRRVNSLFVPSPESGRWPCHGADPRYASDPHWKDLVLFYEYFNGDSGKGCGAR